MPTCVAADDALPPAALCHLHLLLLFRRHFDIVAANGAPARRTMRLHHALLPLIIIATMPPAFIPRDIKRGKRQREARGSHSPIITLRLPYYITATPRHFH